WRRRLRDKESAERAKQAARAASDQSPISHYRLAAELVGVMGERTCLVADGGDVVACASKIVPLSRPAQGLRPRPPRRPRGGPPGGSPRGGGASGGLARRSRWPRRRSTRSGTSCSCRETARSG